MSAAPGLLARRTRGRTARGRLAALDVFLALTEAELLGGARSGAVLVDVGFGDAPWTTLEMGKALAALGCPFRVVGVDLDEARVRTAAAHATEHVSFRQGGALLPLVAHEQVLVIRAMNVLRGYPEEAVAGAHASWGAHLLEGGLLLEGSSDARGDVLVAHVLRRRGARLEREALLFHTTFGRGFAPQLFRDWLPRDLRRRVTVGSAIHAFLEDWKRVWEEARREGIRAPREAFLASTRRLAAFRTDVRAEAPLVERGFLLWRAPD